MGITSPSLVVKFNTDSQASVSAPCAFILELMYVIVLFDKLNVASCFIDEVTDGVGLPQHTALNCIRQRDNSSYITVDGSLPIRVAILS